MYRFFAVAAAVLVCSSIAIAPAAADIVIQANSPGTNGMGATNANIPAAWSSNIGGGSDGSNTTYAMTQNGDGVWGTPNVALAWSATGGTNSNAWQFHAWGGATVANTGGGALQMDGTSVNSVFSVAFTPNPGHRVILNGFNFVGDTNNGATYRYNVDVINLTSSAVVFTTTTAEWITATAQNPGTNGTWANAPGINLGVVGDFGTAYRLDIRRIQPSSGTTGGAVDMAIDNLSFGQQAIPEPGSCLLLGASVLGLLGKRRRSLFV